MSRPLHVMVGQQRATEDTLLTRAIEIVPLAAVAALFTMMAIWRDTAIPLAILYGVLFLAVGLIATELRHRRARKNSD